MKLVLTCSVGGMLLCTAHSGLRSLPSGTYVGITACFVATRHFANFIGSQDHCPDMKLVKQRFLQDFEVSLDISICTQRPTLQMCHSLPESF